MVNQEIERLWREDADYIDWTTLGLGIGEKRGEISFSAKRGGVISGIKEALSLGEACGVELEALVKEGAWVEAGEEILRGEGKAIALHKAWKVTQNLLEYLSGIATFTHEMVTCAKKINPSIEILTTRKNFPGSKRLMLQAILSGGAWPHRLGLFDSVLVFEQHRVFLEAPAELEQAFKALKRRLLEKKIAVEVSDFEEAKLFASWGADILQCEKMELGELARCVELKRAYPSLLLSATGGVKIENVMKIAQSGVDFVVTSAPYHANPLDIKVRMKKRSEG